MLGSRTSRGESCGVVRVLVIADHKFSHAVIARWRGALGTGGTPALAESRRATPVGDGGATIIDVLRFEENDPRAALDVVRRVERENGEFSLGTLFLSVTSVTIAGLLAFAVTRNVGTAQTLLTVLILLSIGFVPPIFVLTIRSSRPFGPHGSRYRVAFEIVLAALAAMFQPLIVTFVAMVVLVPVGLIVFGLALLVDWTLGVTVGTAPIMYPVLVTWGWLVGVLAFAIALANVPPSVLFSPIRGIGVVLAGLRLSGRRAADFGVTIIISSMVVGAGGLGLIYEQWWQAAIASSAAGVLLGLTCAPLPRDKRLSHLAELARVRVSIRLEHIASARYRILRLLEWNPWGSPRTKRDDLTVLLAECLEGLVADGPQDCWPPDRWEGPLGGVWGAVLPGRRRELAKAWEEWKRERIAALQSRGIELAMAEPYPEAWAHTVRASLGLLEAGGLLAAKPGDPPLRRTPNDIASSGGRPSRPVNLERGPGTPSEREHSVQLDAQRQMGEPLSRFYDPDYYGIPLSLASLPYRRAQFLDDHPEFKNLPYEALGVVIAREEAPGGADILSGNGSEVTVLVLCGEAEGKMVPGMCWHEAPTGLSDLGVSGNPLIGDVVRWYPFHEWTQGWVLEFEAADRLTAVAAATNLGSPPPLS